MSHFCNNDLVADKAERKQEEEEENFRGVQPSAARGYGTGRECECKASPAVLNGDRDG